MLVWLMIGPGPKYEEGFVTAFFMITLLLFGTGFSIYKPNRWSNVIFFSLANLIWWIVTGLKVSLIYGYPLFNIDVIRMGGFFSFVIGLFLFVVNNVLLWFKEKSL